MRHSRLRPTPAAAATASAELRRSVSSSTTSSGVRPNRPHHMVKNSLTSTGVLLAIAATVLFAVNRNVSKVALLNGISSLELVSVRSRDGR